MVVNSGEVSFPPVGMVDQAATGAMAREMLNGMEVLEAAINEAESGVITNGRKMEALATIDRSLSSLAKAEVVRHQSKFEDLCERLLTQNATQPLRRAIVILRSAFHKCGNSSSLTAFVSRLLKTAGDQNKKVTTNSKVAALDVVGELVKLHGRVLESFGTDIFVVVVRHMKFTEANLRVSAFQCLCSTMSAAGVTTLSIANNIWKMLQKVMPDKAITVRTASAHALAALAVASPGCVAANGEAMAVCCLKALSADDPGGHSNAVSSESKFAFASALSKVLSVMASPALLAGEERPKKRPVVIDWASALDFLEQASAKGPPSGNAFVNFRAALSLAAVQLATDLGIDDSPSIILGIRMLVNILEPPAPVKVRGGVLAEDDCLPQLERQIAGALCKVTQMASSETCLLQVIEQGLMPMVIVQPTDPSAARGADVRLCAILEALSSACIAAGEGFRSIETKVGKPLLHLVGNHPNPTVQLHSTHALRVVAHSSPPQLFQLMSVLLNLATVQNAELLGTPLPRQRRDGSGSAAAAAAAQGQISADLQTLLRGLFGHCCALAALVGELFQSDLGVPHDVTSNVLGTVKALLQPHPNSSVSAQRRSCAFILLEGLMCLGTDWVGQRLTALFTFWKAALGKKPVDRAKVLYQQHIATAPSSDGNASAENNSNACRDELLSLLFALRSLHAFTVHFQETLRTSLPHLHKILVVFLTHISQLIVALPHPTSPSLRAKYRSDASSRPTITLATRCGIPEVLLAIRVTMYSTFSAMLPAQYSSRFVPLLNMLADDVTRAVPSEFPIAEFLAHFLPPDDVVLDTVDAQAEAGKDCPAITRLAVWRLLATGANSKPLQDAPHDLFSVAAAAGFFCAGPREGPNTVEGMLTPWDAWLDPCRPLAAQCTSPEWEWRSSAVSLLATIMNSSEVGEAPRAAVLTHLLKKREPSEETAASQGKRGSITPSDMGAGAVSSLAVLVYLREHVRARGLQCMPPHAAMETILNLSLDGLKDPSPVLRRIHVETLAMLFYIHHELSDAPTVPTVLQHLSSEPDSERGRSAAALLCGSLLRAFTWGRTQGASGPVRGNGNCPYLANIVPVLLRLGKDQYYQVRLWMLHAVHISMQAAGPSFDPFLKDALNTATAHLLADFFESPLVIWAIAEVAHTAAACVLPKDSLTAQGDVSFRKENISRLASIWQELERIKYTGELGGQTDFAVVRAEALCTSMANAMVKHAPESLPQMKDVLRLVSSKLAPQDDGDGAPSSVVRAAAARSITGFLENGLCSSQEMAFVQEPSQLFSLLQHPRDAETSSLEELIRALVRQRGLQDLPLWMQTLKEIVLVLAPKAPGTSGNANEDAAIKAAAEEAANRDEQDDSASIAGPKREDTGSRRPHRIPHLATKVFAVSCVQLLVEQAEPSDTSHFQPETTGDSTTVSTHGHRLVHHLETLVALATHASSADEASFAAAGVRLMLLIVQLFQRTRDLQGQMDVGDCPLLLVQYEAQVTSCIRHNLRPEANPEVVCLALELLCAIVGARACNSTQRLVTLLVQPFSSPTFEPDPLFCESTSTKVFLYRLRCACEILDSECDEQSIQNHMKDLSRVIEYVLRDAAVLHAGLPLQSIKTYQPICFCLTDYKAVQPYFRDALPMILRGVCVLCDEQRSSKLTATPSSDLLGLSLGIISLLLGDRRASLSNADGKVVLRVIRRALLRTAGGDIPGSGALITLEYFLDLFDCVWNNVFRVRSRCVPLLPDMLELMHAVSGAVSRRRQKLRAAPPPPETENSAEDGWLDGLCKETAKGRESRQVVGAYSLHVVAASLRCPAIREDSASVSQALEIFVRWLEDSLPASLDSVGAELDDLPDDELAAVVQEDTPVLAGVEGDAIRRQCCWLWLLFLSPFPVELVQEHATITLKFWKVVCTVLSNGASAGSSVICVDKQLLYISLIANKLAKHLMESMREGEDSLTAAEERTVVYLFALFVPVISALCAVLDRTTDTSKECIPILETSTKTHCVSQCMGQIGRMFLQGVQHRNAKVVQTAISSMQNLLQNQTCMVLCPVMVPSLMSTLVGDPEAVPEKVLESAWGVVSTMITTQQTRAPSNTVQATTKMVLGIVLCMADYNKLRSNVSAAQTAAMARCLVQVARVDQVGLKAEVASMSSESQRTIQELLREHMTSQPRGERDPAESPNKAAALATSKIELKLKF